MLTNMTRRTNRETSSVIVRAVCARVCAGRCYNSPSRKKGYWVGSTYSRCKVHRSVEDIYGCLGERYFQRAYRISYESFWLLHRKLSTRIAKAVDDSRRYKRKGGREGTISFLLFIMALLPLAFGWLVLCGFLLVPCRTTLWQSMELAKSQCQRVYGQ